MDQGERQRKCPHGNSRNTLGNKVLAATVRKLLTSMTKPIYSTLVRWLLDGVLEDPYGEFFVASAPDVSDEAKLWFDKYSIRKSMIPKFLSLSWVKKILNTGKSINFLRCVCDDSTSNITNREKVMHMLDQAWNTQLSGIEPLS